MPETHYVPIDNIIGTQYNDVIIKRGDKIMYDTKIHINTEKDVKDKATKIYNALGLDLTTAINMFLRKSIQCNGIPFDLYLDQPSESTLEAFKEEEEMKNNPKEYKRYKDMDELWEDLNK